MSNLLPYTVDQLFINGVTQRLQPGEQLVTMTPVFQFETHSIWNKAKNTYEQSISVRHVFLALTSTSIRVVTFSEVKVKRSNEGKGRLGKVLNVVADVGSPVMMPTEEVNSMTQFSLNAVSGVHYHQGVIQRDHILPLFKSGLKTVNKKSVLAHLRFESAGTTYNFSSIYESLDALSRNLDAYLSGSVMSTNINRVEDALTRLAALVADGVITSEEFETAKSGFIGRTEVTQESAISAIRQLASLHSAGVLTDAEFKAKKFELLAKD